MTRRLTSLIAALALAVTALVAASAATNPAHAADRDCGDFNTQKAAQDFFINNGGPNHDPHRLDSDGDGVACESNPCPCSTDKGGGGGGGGGGNQPTPLVVQRAKIVRVIDGDTVQVDLNKGPKVSVRLLGIDTPEVYGGTECWGPQASRTAKRLLPRGTRVVLRSDRTQPLKDRYKRLLRYVAKGKKDIGKIQVHTGNASVYVVGKRFVRYSAYKRVERAAKRRNRGMWGNC